eukprot:GFYU01010574.1.p1 GENE.GFYU01010574.1~~GFYU01010574.1.p1  ORF type:complete len:193 (+),score=29.43 GFYU01010574.1:142-720(+)
MDPGRKGKGVNILDRPLSKGKSEVSLSAFSFVFSELVQYAQLHAESIHELEKRLEDAGHAIGLRLLELVFHRERGSRRETKFVKILTFIQENVWQVLFGKKADPLTKSIENDDEYMITDKEPLVNKFVSVPREMGDLNCAAFVAGIVRGILNGADFPCRVSAHQSPAEGLNQRVTILIKFDPEVLERDKKIT